MIKISRFALSIITLTLLSSLVFTQEARVDRTEELKGPVHLALVESSEIVIVNGKETEINLRQNRKIIYDPNHHEIERTNYNRANGSIENHLVHIIDNKGRVIGAKSYQLNPDGKGERLIGNYTFRYVENGSIIETQSYIDDRLSGITKSSYDNNGLLLEETKLDGNRTVNQVTKKTYDRKGNLLTTATTVNSKTELLERFYDDAGHLIRYKQTSYHGESNVINYIYDSSGREIERNGDSPEFTFKDITTYDAKGRVIRKVYDEHAKPPGGPPSEGPEPGIIEYSYDEKDQVIEEQHRWPGGALQNRELNSYDAAGRLQSSEFYDNNNALMFKGTFEYDRWGNCIKTLSKHWDHGQIFMYVTRVIISYYDNK